jgi:hypothetical protein
MPVPVRVLLSIDCDVGSLVPVLKALGLEVDYYRPIQNALYGRCDPELVEVLAALDEVIGVEEAVPLVQ